MQRDEAAGDRRGARAAVGLEHVAVDLDGALPERAEIGDGAQRTADQALDFLGASGLLAACRFAIGARVRGARQHPVLRADPAAAAVLEKRRHALLDARGAQHARVAELDEHRALGVPRVAALYAHRAQLFGRPLARPAERSHCEGAFLRSAALISAIAFSMSSSDILRKSGWVALKSCTSVGRS